MPELPDIEIFSRNLKKQFAGNLLSKIIVANGKKLLDSQKDLSKALKGKKLNDIYRSGKEIHFRFDKDVIMGMHLMLTGDIYPFIKKNHNKSTIVELHFNNGKGLALTDRMKNAFVKLNPEEKAGIDALDINYNRLKIILKRKSKIKNLLRDQNIIRGIGNAYSDEILWECRISPFSIADRIPDEKIKELAKTIKKVFKNAITKISKTYPDLIHGEVKEFFLIHTRKYSKSPTGASIKIMKSGMMKTYYTDEQVLYK